MSDYPAWAYKQQLQQKYQKELSNPLIDQSRAFEIRKAIEEKTQEFIRKQEQSHRTNIERLKKEMS